MELARVKNQLSLSKKAYKTLDDALQKKELSDLEKDGVVQRFEYNIELLRKTSKLYLIYKWVDFISSPKDIFKELYKLWLIIDLELFYSMLDARNAMSHMYSEYLSKETFEFISQNYTNINVLLLNIESKI